MKEIVNPFESLHNCIVLNSRDWSQNKGDAWIYGIIVGWINDETTEKEAENLFQEFSEKFNWDRKTWDRL